MAQAHEHFGRLDVVVNNAGYGLFGTIEEVSEEQARAQIETNLFGALWVTQAALPIMRGQGSGHILQVSSIGGVAAFPMVGLYHASKWGLEGFSDTLPQEVAHLGIRVTLIKPGPYGTDWSGSSAVRADPIEDYEPVREMRRQSTASRTQADPEATAEAVLKVVDSQEPPLRLFLGTWPLPVAEKAYAQRLETWRAWNEVAEAAQG